MTTFAAGVDFNGVDRALSTLAREVQEPTAGLEQTGSALLEEVRPLVPVLTGRLVSDLKAEVTGDTVAVSIGTTPRVGDYAAIINAREGYMTHGQEVGGEIAVDALTAAVDDLIRSVGLS